MFMVSFDELNSDNLEDARHNNKQKHSSTLSGRRSLCLSLFKSFLPWIDFVEKKALDGAPKHDLKQFD